MRDAHFQISCLEPKVYTNLRVLDTNEAGALQDFPFTFQIGWYKIILHHDMASLESSQLESFFRHVALKRLIITSATGFLKDLVE